MTASKIFLFSLVLNNLIMMCFGVVLFLFPVLGFVERLGASCVGLAFSSSLEIFQPLFLQKYFFGTPISFFSVVG